jgi:polyisoprenoid-binding protein YceI
MDWQFDPAHTTVEAKAKHMMLTTVRVRFPGASGEIRFDPDRPEAAVVRLGIPVASLSSGDERRDAHLRSGDFFDADKHPTIEFRSRGVRTLQSGRFEVSGDLTMRGATRPVRAEVSLQALADDPTVGGRKRAFVEASATIDRRDWGLVWNMPVPQGVLVSNDVAIDVAAELLSALPMTQAA